MSLITGNNSSAGGSPRVVYASVFFVLVMVLVIIVRPRPLFDDKGELTRFGVSQGATPLSLGVATAVLAVSSMFLFTMIDLVF